MATHCPARKSRSVAKFMHDREKPAVLVADAGSRRARGSRRTTSSAVSSAHQPVFSSFLLTVKPGVPRSMTSSEMPPWPGPPVRTAVVTRVGAAARGDERLGAVDDVVIAVAHGARA